MSYDAQRLIGLAMLIAAGVLCLAVAALDAWDRTSHVRACKVPHCSVCGVKR